MIGVKTLLDEWIASAIRRHVKCVKTTKNRADFGCAVEILVPQDDYRESFISKSYLTFMRLYVNFYVNASMTSLKASLTGKRWVS